MFSETSVLSSPFILLTFSDFMADPAGHLSSKLEKGWVHPFGRTGRLSWRLLFIDGTDDFIGIFCLGKFNWFSLLLFWKFILFLCNDKAGFSGWALFSLIGKVPRTLEVLVLSKRADFTFLFSELSPFLSVFVRSRVKILLTFSWYLHQ